MKKLYFGLIIALVLCSCAKTAPAGIETGEMIIGASMEVYPSISKAALADAGSFTWQTGDVIEVATSKGHAQFNLKTGAETASATFGANYSGTLGSYATYPADIFDSESKIKIPASREWSEGNTNCSMFGSVDGDNVAFKHLGGVVKVTLNGVPANAKKFVFSTPGKKITGEFDIQTETGENGNKYIATSDDSNDANSSYTLSFNLSEAKNMAFYIPVPCGTYPKFAFKLQKEDNTVLYEFEGISAQTVNRKDILLMPASTIGTDSGDGNLLTSVPSGTSGNYSLPAAESVILYFEGESILGEEVINLKYAEGSNLPKRLCLKVKDGNKINVSGNLPNTHVEFDQGEIVTASLKTSATTFKIIAPAKISEKLVVKGGNVEITGEISGADNVKAIEIEAEATADGSSAPVQITIENNATIGTSGTGGENGGITTSANVVIVNNTDKPVNVTVPTTAPEAVQVASAGTGTGEVKKDGEKVITKPAAVIGTQNFFTLADAFAAVQEGQTIEIIKEGSYAIPSPINNITVKGADNLVTVADDWGTHPTVVFDASQSSGQLSSLNGVVFSNIKFLFSGNGYTGFQHQGATVTFNNCDFEGLFNGYGNMIYNNCYFKQTKAEYVMWTYGSRYLEFNDCSFDVAGKALNVYQENDPGYDHIIKITKCRFVSSTAIKPALAIKNNGNGLSGTSPIYYDITITNSTFEGFGQSDGDLMGFPTDAPYINAYGYNGETQPLKVTVDGQIKVNIPKQDPVTE